MFANLCALRPATRRPNTRRPSTKCAAALFVVLATVGVAACSSDSPSAGPPTSVQQIRDATVAAGSASYQGQVHFADGSAGLIKGMTAADPARGDVTFPVQTTGGTPSAEFTWVDDTLYVQRVVGPALPGAAGLVGALVRAEADRPWVKLPLGGIAQTLAAPYDPYALLDQLAAMDTAATFRADGSESVNGMSLSRSVVEAQGDGTLLPGVHLVELLTDSDQRLVVVRLTGDQTIEYTLSDFGVDVSVTAPSADQIAVSVVTDNGEDPAGPYEQVAAGVVDGVAWQLQRAPATGNGSCWRLDLPGVSDLVAATEADGSTCIAAIDPTSDEPVQVVADTGSGAPLEGIVAVMPAGSQAVLHFVDRSSQTVSVDPRGFLVWLGPKDPMLVVLDVTLPDGTQEECGPGSVSGLDDLDGLDSDALLALRDAPWLCLPA